MNNTKEVVAVYETSPPADVERPDTQEMPRAAASHWNALYCRHQHEKTIARQLEWMGFEIFLPLYRQVRMWSDRRKELALPLFPCYVFFAGNLARRLDILNAPEVHSVVATGGKAAIIPAEELDAVRRIVASALPFEPHPFLQRGDRVIVRSGPLKGIEGIVACKKDSLKIVLSVDILGRSVAVEVDEALLERVRRT